MPETFVCACCGGIDRSGDDIAAHAEADRNGLPPDDRLMVCQVCFDIATDLSTGDPILAVPALN